LKSPYFLLYNQKYDSHTDLQIITEFVSSGDNNLVGILYKRYGHLVLGLALKYLKNSDDAQDAVVQIFTDLIADLKKHRITYFKSWLYVYSKNFCLMELRKRQSLLKKELEMKDNRDLIMDFSDPAHLKEKEEQIVLLEQTIETLNDEQRKCIRLFYIENKSYHDITAITGYTANDVKSYIQNGKRNLKLKMEAYINEQAKK
jgi:RNA polymerase sigma factor (sigma-70 family)